MTGTNETGKRDEGGAEGGTGDVQDHLTDADEESNPTDARLSEGDDSAPDGDDGDDSAPDGDDGDDSAPDGDDGDDSAPTNGDDATGGSELRLPVSSYQAYITEHDDLPTDTDEAIEHLLSPRPYDAPDAVPTALEDLKYIGPATAESLSASNIDAGAIVDGDVCYRDLVEADVNPGVAAKIRRWHSLSWSFGSGEDLDRRSSQVRGLGDDEREWVAASSGDWGTDDEDDTSGDWTPTGQASVSRGPDREGDWEPSGADATNDDSPTQSGDWTPSGPDESRGNSPNRGGDWTPRGGAETQSGASADGSGDALAAEAAWRERSKPEPVTTLDGIDADDADLLAEAGVRSVRRLATADPEHVADALQIDPTVVNAWKSQALDAME
ncbi:hypothetical protein C440_01455 [Haloferax mucosum ATCC BAA-1512]|uniref:DUF7409 domain-containing protein n=1 Tax=Haloferax mucosum ATCC BAA-1512 TaxID=662479 RepID=M0IQ70_9EURY|nr:helix-hairpin-helix domain-containing protein [Haloferax mucosum]ELZ98981.1 hypothetical protein C440_01455 [Haloferax mucosum ATCC BAA-1512]